VLVKNKIRERDCLRSFFGSGFSSAIPLPVLARLLLEHQHFFDTVLLGGLLVVAALLLHLHVRSSCLFLGHASAFQRTMRKKP